MDAAADPRALAAAWRPPRPAGRADRVADALVEPAWGGAHGLLVLAPPGAPAFLVDGAAASLGEELAAALARVFLAEEAIVEGHLTPEPLRPATGRPPEPVAVPRQPLLIPRLGRRDVREDPFVRERAERTAAAAAAAAAVEAAGRGEPVAFVAVDLAWLDGRDLGDLPLLERRRLLEAVLGEDELVRRTPWVRPTAAATLAGWRQLGFAALLHKGANSRWRPGAATADWALVRPRPVPGGGG